MKGCWYTDRREEWQGVRHDEGGPLREATSVGTR